MPLRSNLDLSSFRAQLEEERRRLLHQIEHLDAQAEAGRLAGEASELSNYDQHMADQATATFLREQDQAILLGLQHELKRLEAAWHKLETGSYGVCDRCGARIPAARLEILPSAIFCIRCADEMEGRL